MNHFLSQLHARLRGARKTREGATHNPADVLRGLHKAYPRMSRVALPEPHALSMPLSQALHARYSYTRGGTAEAFSPLALSSLLGHALRKSGDRDRRPYPSGGALYPIETYLLGLTILDRAPGAYHYHPTDHALEHMWDLEPDFTTHAVTTTEQAPVGSALLVLTATWDRSSAKYGNLSYLHALLEAGHIAQNILLTATALEILARPLAGFDDETVLRLLDLDDTVEQPVYAVLLSTRVAPIA